MGDKNEFTFRLNEPTIVSVKHVVGSWTDCIVHCFSSNRLCNSVAQEKVDGRHQLVIHRRSEEGLDTIDDAQILFHKESNSVLLLFQGG